MSFCMPGITHCEEHGNPIGLGYVCEECEEKRKLKDIDADKMFEELGYRKSEEENRIIYSKPLEGDFLYFWLDDKEVSKDRFMCGGYISMQELKVINKKCEELGWV